jgi:polyisoprenoid-binding protein YceI
MTFKSTAFTPMDKEGKNYKLTGKLTIRDVTKDVTWNVKYGGQRNDNWGNTKAGFKATSAINRFDFGLKWDTMTENVAVVADSIQLVCNIEMKLDKDKDK